MITSAYKCSDSIIDSAMLYQPIDDFPELVLSCFSSTLTQILIEETNADPIYVMEIGGHASVIYEAEYNGTKIAFYHGMVGGPASAMLLEKVINFGAKNILFFGKCGTLDSSISPGTILVPTHAYRDEGTSYHYIPASDFIEIETAAKLCESLTKLGVRYQTAKTWTTDAIYRETKERMAEMKKVGCTCVDMECASVMAVGKHKNVNVFEFLYATDCLDGSNWNPGILLVTPDDVSRRIAVTALNVLTGGNDGIN